MIPNKYLWYCLQVDARFFVTNNLICSGAPEFAVNRIDPYPSTENPKIMENTSIEKEELWTIAFL
jgi:hypothetical protein